MPDGVVGKLIIGLISTLWLTKMSVIDIPFTNFSPQLRGFRLDGPELDTSQINEFALYQYDKTDGPFELRLISVEAYMESKQP